MQLNQFVIKRLFSLDRVKVVKLKDNTFMVRGRFSLRNELDEIKKFIFIRRHVPALSYLRFRHIPFLRPFTFIELRVHKLAEEDFEKLKKQLWYKLNVHFSHKLEQVLLPRFQLI
ncbi:MAG: hypothetical protein HQ564_06220 [Candidatus Saganbacteria bacterium]|nr:hypothetical protein [Candidatus Saganbacteria bacterium]